MTVVQWIKRTRQNDFSFCIRRMQICRKWISNNFLHCIYQFQRTQPESIPLEKGYTLKHTSPFISCFNSSSSSKVFSDSLDESDRVNSETNVDGTLHAFAIAYGKWEVKLFWTNWKKKAKNQSHEILSMRSGQHLVWDRIFVQVTKYSSFCNYKRTPNFQHLYDKKKKERQKSFSIDILSSLNCRTLSRNWLETSSSCSLVRNPYIHLAPNETNNLLIYILDWRRNILKLDTLTFDKVTVDTQLPLDVLVDRWNLFME